MSRFQKRSLSDSTSSSSNDEQTQAEASRTACATESARQSGHREHIHLKKVTPLTWETAPDILTAEEAAALVRIPRNAFYGAIKAGLVPHHNFGSRLTRIAKSALMEVFGLKPQDKGATAAFSQSGGVK